MTGTVPLVEVTRQVVGGDELVESVHRGHIAVVAGPVGGPAVTVFASGDPDSRTFVRSSAKPFQVTACLELLDEHDDDVKLPLDELAIAWSSHRGEPRHLDAVRALLARSGTAPEDLTTPPSLAAADKVWPPASPGEPPSPLRHNCSGKHALFALVGASLGLDRSTLLDPDAPLQRRVLGVLDDAIGPLHGHGVDGCGAPAVLAPLAGLAGGYRSLAADDRWSRVREAGLAHPGLIGGEGRPETALLAAGVVAKYGAEGVYAAGWVDHGIAYGAAVKVADGADRAGGVALIEVLAAYDAVPRSVWSPDAPAGGGHVVGRVRPTAALVAGLDARDETRAKTCDKARDNAPDNAPDKTRGTG